jgi:hypothetical protein
MSVRPRMRPVFEVLFPGREPAARDRLLRALASPECPFRGGPAGDYVEMKVPEEEEHFWSPQLRVWFGADGQGDDEIQAYGSEERPLGVLHGRFEPHPNVWTMFLAIYAHLAMGSIAAGMFAAAQVIVLEQSPTIALYVLGTLAVLAGFVYLSAFFGQGLGNEQMFQMRRFVSDAVVYDPY